LKLCAAQNWFEWAPVAASPIATLQTGGKLDLNEFVEMEKGT
jgi:hypothetical protein